MASLAEWIPKYIRRTMSWRPGQTPTADELNTMFNLLTLQGDNNTEYLDYLITQGTYEIIKKIIEEGVDELNANMGIINSRFSQLQKVLDEHSISIDVNKAANEVLLDKVTTLETRVQDMYKNYLLSDTITNIVYKIAVANGQITAIPFGIANLQLHDTTSGNTYEIYAYNTEMFVKDSTATGVTATQQVFDDDVAGYSNRKLYITNGELYLDDTTDAAPTEELWLIDDVYLNVFALGATAGVLYYKEANE